MGKGGEALIGAKMAAANPASASGKAPAKYTWEEVKKHITPEDAWVVYQNKVYDVSNWHDHPGGAVIFTHAGDDMTDIFAAFHAQGSQAMIKKFFIGDLIPESVTHKDERQLAFEKGYRDLRAKLIMMGMFKSSKLYYAYKCLFNMGMWATACAMVYYSDSIAVHIGSALLMGLFWQQCGWLAHDFLHHQVFKKRKYGDLVGVFWGDLMQGYSMQWWKNKHNGHHAVPNLHNSTAQSQDGDPDIDTMPLLAWSLKQAQSFRELRADGKDSPFVKFMIKWQAFTYFPILLLARLSWLNESFKTAFGLGAASANAALEMKRKGLQYPYLEKMGITLHWAWVIAVSSGFGRFSVPYSLMYFLISTCSCGLFLALVFGLGHNGMATYDATTRPDFWKLQVTTTRNITGGHGIPQFFVDWLCGGLQYQVDHHLFPMMPRHNLARTHELIESFCKEWGVKYHETDLVDGTVEVLQHLQKVSDEFIVDMIKEFPAM
jgi:fatty acid desaturase/predicted heme/steroid binding protein|eukprot:CAMPEP_0113586950 /NCGR_PEP_ID=MMETSP0015_2-20120614/34598_1 /TAXON_ID=2838 /ORGANISM="Odontella" /LENGTH=488 /DNA_ID=CAMNT_0000492477 /DNA_START=105 /DNA_END=1571 /DNA_ORIENTATION=+ /assembly_acc=CAM_ASM_000160